jgi:hypothetical protein
MINIVQFVFSWGHVSKRIVRLVLIVVSVPFTRDFSHIIQCPKHLHDLSYRLINLEMEECCPVVRIWIK